MKKLSYLFIILLVSKAGFSQADPSLNRRLKEYTRLTMGGNFEELIEYMHPRLYTLAPREELIESFKNTYENEVMKIKIEKIENRSISNPFKLEGVQYRKVDYYMLMYASFKDEGMTSDSATNNMMVSILRKGLPDKEISYDASSKRIVIKGMYVLIAIKDNPQTPWLFLGDDGNNETVKKLFPQEVIEHFKLQ